MESVLIRLLYFALLNALLVFAGYVLVKKGLVWQSWVLLLVSVSSVHIAFLQQPPVLRMLVLIITAFVAMKVIAATVSYYHKPVPLTFKQWLFFTIGWAGMRPQPFETIGGAALPNAWPMIRFGISRAVIGGALLLMAHAIVFWFPNSKASYAAVSVLLLVSFSFILHFGLLSISAGVWRLQGVNTYYLFKQPVKATTVSEFWSKRWNLAFSEMTSISVFRPLRSRAGNKVALLAAFLFSGLLHELALSVPVHNGYGLPLFYFFIQGIMVWAEKAMLRCKHPILQHTLTSRLWTFFWVIAPAPLLFHITFVKQILWPLAGLIAW